MVHRSTSHGWLDNYGKNNWDYWKVYVQEIDSSVWLATLNIANTVDGEKILYEIDPIEKVEGVVKSTPTSTKESINPDEDESQAKDNISVKDTEGTQLTDAQIEVE